MIPDNADPTRTHLNREFVKMPSGVYGRDEAIAHRIKTAGIKRKKANAVRLCADDVLNRDKMVGYHDSYAEAMGKYG